MLLQIIGSGTSTGVPVPGCECAVCQSNDPKNERLRTSALLTTANNRNILIDSSPDLRQQALKYRIKRLDAVLYTHGHADHILGLEDLRCFNYVQKAKIPCYGYADTFSKIRKCFDYVFSPDPNYEGGLLPDLTLHEIADTANFEVEGVKIQAFPVLHGRTKVAGFRFGELAYATDCKGLPDISKQIVKGVRYLILDGLRYEQHKTHHTIPEAVELAKELGVEMTYLIHMTHSVDYWEVSKSLPKFVALCYDGLQIEFNPV